MKKNQHFPKLFERGYIAGLEIKNRIVRRPWAPSWAIPMVLPAGPR